MGNDFAEEVGGFRGVGRAELTDLRTDGGRLEGAGGVEEEEEERERDWLV